MMKLRDLPSVEAVVVKLESRYPRNLIVSETRRILSRLRTQIREGQEPETPVEDLVAASLARLSAPSLKPVINATGVVLHTNLGRAPLPTFTPISGYSNLEYNLDRGARGKRASNAAQASSVDGDSLLGLLNDPNVTVPASRQGGAAGSGASRGAS